MKTYKIRVVATKTVTLTEKDWTDEGMPAKDFNEFTAGQFAKGCLIEDLTNNPNRGTVTILSVNE